MSEQIAFWEATYTSGKTLKEQRDDFRDIKKDKVKYFSLKGEQINLTHNTETGEIILNDNNILILLNDKLIGKSKDIINFKKNVDLYKNPTKPGKINRNIVSYYSGWKEKNDEFHYIEILFWVDMVNKKLKLRTRLTPLINEGVLSVIINGKINNIELELEKNKKQEFVFEV